MRCITSGVRVSYTSAGTPATPLGKPFVCRPSFVARAPAPPDWNSVNVNRSSRPGQVPRQTVSQDDSAPPAISRPGIAFASAPKIVHGSMWPIRWRAATAAGSRQFRIEPSGAVVVTGRNAPSLCGTSGFSAALIANDE